MDILLASIAPAHGKTLIIQLIGAMIIEMDPLAHVIICTSNEFLATYAVSIF